MKLFDGFVKARSLGAVNRTPPVAGPTRKVIVRMVSGEAGEGEPGPAGPANSLSIGTVTTGAAGSTALASVTGEAPNQTLHLTIPRGNTGDAGSAGSNGTNATLPVIQPYATGTFTVPTGNFALHQKRLVLTGSQRATLAGDARLRVM